jgi:signal peptidase I
VDLLAGLAAAEQARADARSNSENTESDEPEASSSFVERSGSEDDTAGSADDETPSDGGGTNRRRLSGTVKLIIVIVIAALAALGLRTYVVAPYYIPSASMEPTLHGCPGCDNDHVLIDKLSYKLHDVHRGDIVVFNRPATWSAVAEKVLIKRVIGLPGDVLSIKSGALYVNGQQLDEPYVNPSCPKMQNFADAPNNSTATVLPPVPKGEVFVMGDNRCESEDSRAFGPVPTKDIIGRAFLIIWPLRRVHSL